MFTVMNVFAKLLSAGHSVIEIAFYRNLIACMPFLILVFVFGRRDILVIRSKPSLVGLRAILGAVSLMTTFAAFSLMPEEAAVLTIEFKVNLLAPGRGERFLFRGEVTKPGRTIMVTDGRAYAIDGDGEAKMIATMSATMMAVHGRDNLKG